MFNVRLSLAVVRHYRKRQLNIERRTLNNFSEELASQRVLRRGLPPDVMTRGARKLIVRVHGSMESTRPGLQISATIPGC